MKGTTARPRTPPQAAAAEGDLKEIHKERHQEYILTASRKHRRLEVPARK